MSAALKETGLEASQAARRAEIVSEVERQGLLGAKDRTIGGRVPAALVNAAKARCGITSDSELLVYALSKVALEDDFGWKFLELEGTVPRDVVLDF